MHMWESNHGLAAATHPRQPNENEILRVRHSRSHYQSMLMHARRPLNQSPARAQRKRRARHLRTPTVHDIIV